MRRYLILPIFVLTFVFIHTSLFAQDVTPTSSPIQQNNSFKVEITVNDKGQKALRLTGTLNPAMQEKLKKGLVSWAFINKDFNVTDMSAVKNEIINNYFGFRNDPEDLLIDADGMIKDDQQRIVLFDWECVTETCDNTEDIGNLFFVASSAYNFHALELGKQIEL